MVWPLIREAVCSARTWQPDRGAHVGKHVLSRPWSPRQCLAAPRARASPEDRRISVKLMLSLLVFVFDLRRTQRSERPSILRT